MELGSILIDLGAGTTDALVLIKGAPISTTSIQVGGNTGNLIFYNAVKEQISFLREIDINSNIDSSVKMVVIPCSNFIQKRIDKQKQLH